MTRVLVNYDELSNITEIFLGSPSSECYSECLTNGVYISRDVKTNEIKSIKIVDKTSSI